MTKDKIDHPGNLLSGSYFHPDVVMMPRKDGMSLGLAAGAFLSFRGQLQGCSLDAGQVTASMPIAPPPTETEQRLRLALETRDRELAGARETIWRLEAELRTRPKQRVRAFDLATEDAALVEAVRIGDVIVFDYPRPQPEGHDVVAELRAFSARVMQAWCDRGCGDPGPSPAEGFGALEDPPPATPLPVTEAKPALPIAALGGGDGIWRG